MAVPTLKLLTGESAEMAALQLVIEAAPAYSRIVTGGPPGPADAQSLYSILPDGKSYEDKFVLGVYLHDEMVGCVDLIRGYPDAQTAYIGLLLLDEAHQRRGIGACVAGMLEGYVARWGTCSHLRLGVLRSNPAALAFWSRVGFVATGEVKPYAYDHVRSESLLFTKDLGDEPNQR